jgi:hypothetical protein
MEVGLRGRVGFRLWFQLWSGLALRLADLRLLELAVVEELRRRWWLVMGAPEIGAMAGRLVAGEVCP